MLHMLWFNAFDWSEPSVLFKFTSHSMLASVKVKFMHVEELTLHKKWSFPLKISSVNVTKFAGNCSFGQIYWRNPWWKTSFFVQCQLSFNEARQDVYSWRLNERAESKRKTRFKLELIAALLLFCSSSDSHFLVNSATWQH